MVNPATAADMVSADTVDTIVARVMAALRGEPAPPTAPQGTTAGRTPAPQEPAEVVLAERVVTAAALAEKTRPGQAVRLVEGAVVTPAARDFIKQHRLRVGRAIPRGADPAPQPAKQRELAHPSFGRIRSNARFAVSDGFF